MRRQDSLQRAGATAGKGAQQHSRKLSAVHRLLGNGPIENFGPNGARVGSAKIPAVATRAASGSSTWPNTATIVTWGAFYDSPDVVWTSATTATIATMGWYDLRALVGASTTAIGTQTVAWYKNGALVLGHVHAAEAGRSVQADAWEPRVRLNPGDTLSVYTHNDGGTPPTVNETRCSIRLVEELLGEKMLIKATGATVPYSGNADEVWLTRDTASSAIAGTLTSVATVTGLPVGTYQYEYHGIYQTTATTTGAGWAWLFSGTGTGYGQVEVATTGGAAATHAASMAAADATGNLLEAQAGRSSGVLIGSVTVSVDAADTNMAVLVKGHLFVTVAGDFSIQQRAELALSCTARPGSLLILRRLS